MASTFLEQTRSAPPMLPMHTLPWLSETVLHL